MTDVTRGKYEFSPDRQTGVPYLWARDRGGPGVVVLDPSEVERIDVELRALAKKADEAFEKYVKPLAEAGWEIANDVRKNHAWKGKR